MCSLLASREWSTEPLAMLICGTWQVSRIAFLQVAKGSHRFGLDQPCESQISLNFQRNYCFVEVFFSSSFQQTEPYHIKQTHIWEPFLVYFTIFLQLGIVQNRPSKIEYLPYSLKSPKSGRIFLSLLPASSFISKIAANYSVGMDIGSTAAASPSLKIRVDTGKHLCSISYFQLFPLVPVLLFKKGRAIQSFGIAQLSDGLAGPTAGEVKTLKHILLKHSPLPFGVISLYSWCWTRIYTLLQCGRLRKWYKLIFVKRNLIPSACWQHDSLGHHTIFSPTFSGSDQRAWLDWVF